VFDSNPNWSLGGGSCFIWCSVGQAAQDGTSRAYLAVYDHAKGQPGNPGGCGNAVLVQEGLVGTAHVALTTDGAGKVYFSVNGSVYRYTPADGHVVMVSSGFLFVKGHTNNAHAGRVRQLMDWRRSQRRRLISQEGCGAFRPQGWQPCCKNGLREQL
jgi:hypothetical protein